MVKICGEKVTFNKISLVLSVFKERQN